MGFRSYFDSSSSGGGGGTPGGVNGDLQYNNAGAFGGLTPGAGVTTLLAGTPSGTGGLAGTTSPTFTMGITVSSASATQVLITGGASQSSTKHIQIKNASNTAGMFMDFDGIGNSGFKLTFGGSVALSNGAGTLYYLDIASDHLSVVSGATIGFSSSATLAFTAQDTSISRISAGLIGVGTGGAASFAGNLKLTLLGLGVTPTYGIHGVWTTGLPANQTMLIQDAGATGSTGIFFNAGASQSTNPVLTVQGSNSIQAAGTVKGTLTTLANAVTGLVAGALAALTNASLVITDGAGTVYRIPCVTP